MVRLLAGVAFAVVCALATRATPMNHLTGSGTRDAPREMDLRAVKGALESALAGALAAAAPVPGRVEPARRACEARARGVHSQGARPSTARAFEAALATRGLLGRGYAWIGKMDALARRTRDVILYVPDSLDVTRPIELIVYMEGYGSFADEAIGQRHVAGIARLVAAERNAIYVSPDVPSSAHGSNPRSRALYWSARCKPGAACRGGDQAPGDFIGLYTEVRAVIDRALCSRGRSGRDARFELSLIGFSNGGNGVFSAVRQLADSDRAVTLETVNLTRVVFADAIYGRRWLFQTWDRVKDLDSLRELSLLLIRGPLSGRGAGARNRLIAQSFVRAHAPDLDLSTIAAGRAASGNIRVALLARNHHAIGDYAVYYHPDEVPDPGVEPARVAHRAAR